VGGSDVLDHVAYVPQTESVDWDFPITAGEVVAMGRYRAAGWFRRLGRDDRALAAACLDRVGMAGFARRQIGQLSGGQRQRVFVARALAQQAPVLLLDEPFAGIDAPTVTDLMGVVRRWHDEGRTVVAVLHDLEMVRACFPSTLLLARSAIAWGETRGALRRDNLLRAWGMPQGWDEQAAPCQVARSA
jgi:manganese/zinc/iron transport system ATP- binding protein